MMTKPSDTLRPSICLLMFGDSRLSKHDGNDDDDDEDDEEEGFGFRGGGRGRGVNRNLAGTPTTRQCLKFETSDPTIGITAGSGSGGGGQCSMPVFGKFAKRFPHSARLTTDDEFDADDEEHDDGYEEVYKKRNSLHRLAKELTNASVRECSEEDDDDSVVETTSSEDDDDDDEFACKSNDNNEQKAGQDTTTSKVVRDRVRLNWPMESNCLQLKQVNKSLSSVSNLSDPYELDGHSSDNMTTGSHRGSSSVSSSTSPSPPPTLPVNSSSSCSSLNLLQTCESSQSPTPANPTTRSYELISSQCQSPMCQNSTDAQTDSEQPSPTSQPIATSSYSQSTEPGLGSEGPPDNAHRDNRCKELKPLLPYYLPPTVCSIRDAVSHLTRLDDFSVVKLSHGFFSQVFKVIHFSTKKVMVLKMNKNAGNRANALKEIELLNKLNHRNIVAYMGTVVHEGALHPLLEYINGGTLEQLISQFYSCGGIQSDVDKRVNGCHQLYSRQQTYSPKVHRLHNPDRTFTKLLQDVSRGMAYLHSMGFLHRDLTSKNVFIRKVVPKFKCSKTECSVVVDTGEQRGLQQLDDQEEQFDDNRLEAVIGDFGFATAEPAPDQKLSIVGSPYWLAPECFKNQWYNHKCDIYSFGVICCELNWRIPADPDYLPRCDTNFVVDFDKLPTSNDTLLARVAKLACQLDPKARPEFCTILAMFDSENEDKCPAPKQLYSTNGIISPDVVNSRSNTVTIFRGKSLDSSLFKSSWNGSHYDDHSLPGDVFDRHLLRRQHSANNSFVSYSP